MVDKLAFSFSGDYGAESSSSCLTVRQQFAGNQRLLAKRFQSHLIRSISIQFDSKFVWCLDDSHFCSVFSSIPAKLCLLAFESTSSSQSIDFRKPRARHPLIVSKSGSKDFNHCKLIKRLLSISDFFLNGRKVCPLSDARGTPRCSPCAPVSCEMEDLPLKDASMAPVG